MYILPQQSSYKVLKKGPRALYDHIEMQYQYELNSENQKSTKCTVSLNLLLAMQIVDYGDYIAYNIYMVCLVC